MLIIHLVLTPNYKKRLLKGILAQRLHELIALCIEVNGWKMQELDLQENYVHLVLQFKHDTSVSRMVHLLKTKTNQILKKEFPEFEEFYWGGSFWADEYFAETVGICTLDSILAYVKNQ